MYKYKLGGVEIQAESMEELGEKITDLRDGMRKGDIILPQAPAPVDFGPTSTFDKAWEGTKGAVCTVGNTVYTANLKSVVDGVCSGWASLVDWVSRDKDNK